MFLVIDGIKDVDEEWRLSISLISAHSPESSSAVTYDIMVTKNV